MSARIRLPHKVAKEIDRELRALGFGQPGYSGTTHLVWTHGATGLRVRAPCSPRDWDETRKRVLSKARRAAA